MSSTLDGTAWASKIVAMRLDQTIRFPDRVMSREVGGETVLLDLESEKYYGLDAVGTFVVQRMADGATLEEALVALLDHYDVSREIAERDVQALIAELEGESLVTVIG